MTEVAYWELESKLVTWGLANNNLRAAIIIGSRARYPAPDIYADLDLILFTIRPTDFSKNQGWLSVIAKPWITSLNYTSQDDPEWVLICEDGLKIDLVISKAEPDQDLVDMLANSPYTEVLGRGYRVLIDKTGGEISNMGGDLWTIQPPSFATFNGTFDRTLISLLRAIKFTKRGDLWRAQHVLGSIRQAILQFIEWHTLVTRATPVDTLYDGRSIESRADSRIFEALPLLFPILDQKEISHSLSVSLKTLNYLSLDIVRDLHFRSPDEGQSTLLAWLQEFNQID